MIGFDFTELAYDYLVQYHKLKKETEDDDFENWLWERAEEIASEFEDSLENFEPKIEYKQYQKEMAEDEE